MKLYISSTCILASLRNRNDQSQPFGCIGVRDLTPVLLHKKTLSFSHIQISLRFSLTCFVCDRNINNNSMNRFLSGKKQDQCGNVTYKAAYVFFEKLRILEGESKSAARRKNEKENPYGVSSLMSSLFVTPRNMICLIDSSNVHITF